MDAPTSRKKYYLQCTMDPDWSDDSLVADLCKYIHCSTAVSLRDIFIASSNRRGCFSVKSRKIADKLLISIANNNLSCRGRKPTAQIAAMHSNNFRINLSNLNNVMSSDEFVEWVKSINFDAFDIEMYPVCISKPGPSHCILAFDTIDSAICVKQKLNEQPFRNVPLRFTHWHVPRRSSYPEVNGNDNGNGCSSSSSSPRCTSTAEMMKPVEVRKNALMAADGHKLGIVLGLVDPNCGYSTTSTHSSPATNGPLYLRDANVPPPPLRTAPAPPTAATLPYTSCTAQQTETETMSSTSPLAAGPATALHTKVHVQASAYSSTCNTANNQRNHKRLHLMIPPQGSHHYHNHGQSQQCATAPVSRTTTPPLPGETHRRHLVHHIQSRSATNTPLTHQQQQKARQLDFSSLDYYLTDMVPTVETIATAVEQKQAPPVMQMEYVESLRAEVERQKEYIEQIWKKNQYLESKMAELNAYNARINESYNTLYSKYVHLQQQAKADAVYRWTTEEVIQWLLSVEHGRYYKYKDSFVRVVQQHNVNGSMLAKFTVRELQGLGIFDQHDQYVLLNHIQSLVQIQ